MDRKHSLFAALADFVLSRLAPRRAARAVALRRAQNRNDWARSRGYWAGADTHGGEE